MNEIKLKDVALINSNSISRNFNFDEIEYIDISSVGTGTLLGTQKILLREAPSRAKRLVNAGDTILSTVRPNRRSFLYFKNSKPNLVASTGFAVLTPTKKIDSRYLYYVINDQKVSDYLANSAKGAAYPAVDTEIIGNITLRLPPLTTQQKIASILSAYDDLIENNIRRIKILEEMAQTIYKEWFINFRFPGYEKVNFVDSPLGKIPEGWKVKSFGEIMELNIGGDWGKEEPSEIYNQEVNIIRGTDFVEIHNGRTDTLPTRHIKSNSFEKRKLKVGDIIIENSVNASSRCIGRNIIITKELLRRTGENIICASFCKLFRPSDSKLSFLNHLHLDLLYSEGRMNFYNNVAANGIGNFQSRRFLSNELLIIPDLDSFIRQLNEIGENISILKSKNEILRKTRDLLLPKLMSGEVEV